MSAIREQGHTSLIPYLEQEKGEHTRTWFVNRNDGRIIAVPSSSVSRLLSELNASSLQKLDRPPLASELRNFSGLAVFESNPGTGNPIRTRARWKTQKGAPALGALFPVLRPELSRYETLTGVVFPDTIEYRGSVSAEFVDPWLTALSQIPTLCITRVLTESEQRQDLDRILFPKPSPGPKKVAIFGLGDIGSYVAQALYSMDRRQSNIDQLILASKNTNTVDALRLELEDIELQIHQHPDLVTLSGDNLGDIFQADVILFLASGYIPPADKHSLNIDVRAIQYSANAQIVRELLEQAHAANWQGTLLMASDPVEQLTWAAFETLLKNSNDNQRLAGFGAAINYGRALRQALEMGLDKDSVAIYGAHGKAVVALPHTILFDESEAERLSLRTGLRNYSIRKNRKKPWRAAAQLMSHALKQLITEENTSASIFVPGSSPNDPGAFFGLSTQGDIGMHLWTPTTSLSSSTISQEITDDIPPILEREHRWISDTSQNPGLLYIDPFEGRSDPANATHFAFHQDLFERWHDRAERYLESMNQPFVARAALANTIEGDLNRAIVAGDLAAEAEAKSALLDLIYATVRRSAGLREEKLDLILSGVYGGELFADTQISAIPQLCASIIENLDVDKSAEIMRSILDQRREPEVDYISSESLSQQLPVPLRLFDDITLDTLPLLTDYLQTVADLTQFPMETLKYPHLTVRAEAWKILASLLSHSQEVDPRYAKKILTLCHFGDDLTLYQVANDSSENAIWYAQLIQSERDVLKYFAQRKSCFTSDRNIEDAIVLGTTGDPLGMHHVDVLQAGTQALQQRYPDHDVEAYVSVDSFSRSKAGDFVSGNTPALALRRRIALLQTIGQPYTHVLIPAIPIWFDIANVHLSDQLKQALPQGAKPWRLIGGDSLSKYPQSTIYQQIPHVIDMRSQDRGEMDTALNRLHLNEYVQIDSRHPGSSTLIRKALLAGETPQYTSGLTQAFMAHYNIFNHVNET